MALTLSDIYYETKQTYHLSLLCGERGLSRIMNWVYVSEDISTTSFLQGGELIITTGLSSHSSSHWLRDFIQAIVRQNACGLIVNLGDYLAQKDITPEIISYCNEHDFPVFAMPWKTHIYDITHDYYNRIFYDTQTDNTITNAFFSLLRKDEDADRSILILEEYNYPRSSSYCVCTLLSGEEQSGSADFQPAPLLPDDSLQNDSLAQPFSPLHPKKDGKDARLLHTITNYLKETLPDCHLCVTARTYTMICPISGTQMHLPRTQTSAAGSQTNTTASKSISNRQSDISTLAATMERLLSTLRSAGSTSNFHIGIGNVVDSLSLLSDSFRNAKAALSMAVFQQQEIFSYNEMGFYKLLLSIDDTKLLNDYVQEYLGTLLAYDEAHHSNYAETLRQYILCSGSLQAVAAAMYCHRNTVNYRLHALREDFGIALDDINQRFHYLTAFYILDYLSHTNLHATFGSSNPDEKC